MIEVLEEEQDAFSLSLLKSAKVGWMWQPVIYWPENVFNGPDFARWLQHISHSKIFEYRGDGECNPLWFSEQTFQPFANILVNQFEIAVEGYSAGHQKNLQELQNFQQYLLKNNKHQLLPWLEMPLLEIAQKAQDELQKIREKMRVQEQRMAAINSQNILLQVQRLNETIKKSKRRRKKKQQIYSNGSSRKEDEAEIRQLQPLSIDEQTTNPIDLNEELSLIEHNSGFTAAEAEEMTQCLTVHIEQFSQRKFSYHSDHQESTNQNERSDSKEKMIMNGEPLLTLEEMPEEKIQRKRKRKGRKQREEKQQWDQLLNLVLHKFVTRHLEAASESINTLTNQKLEARMAAFQRVRIFTQNNFPFSNAMLFGSNAIGLALPSSDVDVLLVGFTCNSREECGQLLSHLGYLLSYMGWVASCEVFTSAKVPVLRLQIDWRVPFLQLKGCNMNTEGGQLVKVDITVHLQGCSSKGYESTALMKNWLDIYPYAQKILVLLKNLLAKFDLNENYRGGIGSYCLFVMILSYLHSNKLQLQGKQLSIVFLKLLRWYLNEFDESKLLIWLRQQGGCFIGSHQYAKSWMQEERNSEQRKIDEWKSDDRKGALRLIDPTTNSIMSGSCSQYYRVKDLFSAIVFQFLTIEANIDDALRSSGQTASELIKCFQNKKQSEKWLRRFDQQMGPSLLKVFGLGQ